MKKFARDIQHYLPLLGILVAGIMGFLIFDYDENFQAVIAIATASSYITWGLVHHYLHGDLHISVVLEYVAISILGLVIIFSVIFRA